MARVITYPHIFLPCAKVTPLKYGNKCCLSAFRITIPQNTFVCHVHSHKIDLFGG